jgi:glucan phosphoethanolaminetransferase (alkaline phosphatase superfamily)
MGHKNHPAVPSSWMFWRWVAAAAIPLGLGVTWIVRNFSPIAPDALAIPVACAVVFVMAVAIFAPQARKEDEE